MIDESRTLEIYGYTSDELKPYSQKLVVAVCEDCGKYRELAYAAYHDVCITCTRAKNGRANRGKKRSDEVKQKMRECQTGRKHSEETKQKISASAMGKTHSKEHVMKCAEGHRGNHHTTEAKRKIGDGVKKRFADDPTIIKKISDASSGENNPFYGKNHTKETRMKISAGHQGIPYDEWESYACEQRYCPKFNEACRESNREKYGRRCFICGLPESENVTSTGKHHRLSIHHVDMDKNQGCDGIRWKLIPVCMKHHTHNKLWTARIVYLLDSVWSSIGSEWVWAST